MSKLLLSLFHLNISLLLVFGGAEFIAAVRGSGLDLPLLLEPNPLLLPLEPNPLLLPLDPKRRGIKLKKLVFLQDKKN